MTMYARIEARARRDLQRHARRLAARKESTRVVVSCGLALEMLLDERVGEGIAELMAVSFASVTGESSVKRECFGCLAPWSSTRAVVGVALVEFLDGSDEALVAGLCGDCTGRNDRLLAAVRRDFGDDFRVIHGSGTA
jgi:hypothetical protein